MEQKSSVNKKSVCRAYYSGKVSIGMLADLLRFIANRPEESARTNMLLRELFA